MIKFSQEIPTSMVKEWTSLSDLDFVIANPVLAEKDYAEFLAHRPADRELILDNGYHETGVALSVKDLLEAAKRCRADYIISPDKVGDCAFNLEQYKIARRELAGYKLAVVMTGTPSLKQREADPGDPNFYYNEREQFLIDITGAEMLCCTFKEKNRFDWFVRSRAARMFKRIHLLGVDSLNELEQWGQWAHLNMSSATWSVDTGKALKWALRGKKLDELISLRSNQLTTSKGLPSDASLHILSIPREDVTEEVDKLFRHNIDVLKGICR